MTSDSCILIAVIGSPHGIRGDLRVKSYAAKPEDLFTHGALYTAEGVPCKLKLRRVIADDMLIASIEEVTTRDAAEALKGTNLYIERAQLPNLPEASDEFYYCDLIGLDVKTTQDQIIGKVQAVNNYGAGDFLEIITAEGAVLTLPFTKEAVLEVRLGDKFILINPDHLFE
ncbi:MAG: ribosome maturation factor RimM [Alphaproteobacteria bacterium]